MPEHQTCEKQGPFVGSRCMAGPGGAWAPATIRRVNEDGSFKIEFDAKELIVMQYWHGLTRADISFDDKDKWPAVFERLSASKVGLTKTEFRQAIALLGLNISDEQIHQFWVRNCERLFDIEEGETEDLILNRIFFWDLAQTGLTWYQDTKFEGGKRVKKTDIGLILEQ